MPRRNGRPRHLDDAKRRLLLRRILDGATVASAARSVGCCDRTVQREARRDSLFGWRLGVALEVRDRRRAQRRALERAAVAERAPIQLSRALMTVLADQLRRLGGDKTPSGTPAITCGENRRGFVGTTPEPGPRQKSAA